MGTRADFYVGRGEQAEWLGSVAMDGYPGGVSGYIRAAKSETNFRKAVQVFLEGRDDATYPKDGWPWPWDDSQLTDYAYAFDAGKTWASCFGNQWFAANEEEPEAREKKVAVFPNMKSRQRVTFGKRSGLLIVSAP